MREEGSRTASTLRLIYRPGSGLYGSARTYELGLGHVRHPAAGVTSGPRWVPWGGLEVKVGYTPGVFRPSLFFPPLLLFWREPEFRDGQAGVEVEDDGGREAR